MRIYTRTGDDGTTGLVGNARIPKTERRIECIGEIDELNAAIGLCRSAQEPIALDAELARIQNQLFDLGAEIASPDGVRREIRWIDERHIEALEKSIDAQSDGLPPLKNFILPGGSEAAARLHMARVVCRRAERATLKLAAEASIRDVTWRYLNRLSDWLFIAARTANRVRGVEDVIWTSEEH